MNGICSRCHASPLMPSPRVAGNTSPSPLPAPCARRTAHAASDSGRTLSPVLVSSRRAVRRARSSSFQRSLSTSPRRQPVSSRNLVAAIAAGHTASGGRAPDRLGPGGTARPETMSVPASLGYLRRQLATKAQRSAYSTIAAPLLLPSAYRTARNRRSFIVGSDIGRVCLVDFNKMLRPGGLLTGFSIAS